MQTVVLSIFEVSEHDNQPELEHELLPQYVMIPENTMELSVSSETTFFNMKLQLEICPQLRTQSSAEDRGRIDTRTGPFLYLLARQCRIKRLSFSTMAGVRACHLQIVLCGAENRKSEAR